MATWDALYRRVNLTYLTYLTYQLRSLHFHARSFAMPNDATPLTKLPVAERLKLIEDLWDSLAAEPDQLPLADWHQAALDTRLDAMEDGTSIGVPWDDVKRRITSKT